MLINGVINGQLASLLARFRHLNSIAIVDGPFPSYEGVELVDLAIVKGFPTIPQVLDAILPLLDVAEIILAREFAQRVEPLTVSRYLGHHLGKPTTLVSHEEFKLLTGQTLGIIHTGDAIPYSSVILKSG